METSQILSLLNDLMNVRSDQYLRNRTHGDVHENGSDTRHEYRKRAMLLADAMQNSSDILELLCAIHHGTFHKSTLTLIINIPERVTEILPHHEIPPYLHKEVFFAHICDTVLDYTSKSSKTDLQLLSFVFCNLCSRGFFDFCASKYINRIFSSPKPFGSDRVTYDFLKLLDIRSRTASLENAKLSGIPRKFRSVAERFLWHLLIELTKLDPKKICICLQSSFGNDIRDFFMNMEEVRPTSFETLIAVLFTHHHFFELRGKVLKRLPAIMWCLVCKHDNLRERYRATLFKEWMQYVSSNGNTDLRSISDVENTPERKIQDVLGSAVLYAIGCCQLPFDEIHVYQKAEQQLFVKEITERDHFHHVLQSVHVCLASFSETRRYWGGILAVVLTNNVFPRTSGEDSINFDIPEYHRALSVWEKSEQTIWHLESNKETVHRGMWEQLSYTLNLMNDSKDPVPFPAELEDDCLEVMRTSSGEDELLSSGFELELAKLSSCYSFVQSAFLEEAAIHDVPPVSLTDVFGSSETMVFELTDASTENFLKNEDFPPYKLEIGAFSLHAVLQRFLDVSGDHGNISMTVKGDPRHIYLSTMATLRQFIEKADETELIACAEILCRILISAENKYGAKDFEQWKMEGFLALILRIPQVIVPHICPLVFSQTLSIPQRFNILVALEKVAVDLSETDSQSRNSVSSSKKKKSSSKVEGRCHPTENLQQSPQKYSHDLIPRYPPAKLEAKCTSSSTRRESESVILHTDLYGKHQIRTDQPKINQFASLAPIWIWNMIAATKSGHFNFDTDSESILGKFVQALTKMIQLIRNIPGALRLISMPLMEFLSSERDHPSAFVRSRVLLCVWHVFNAFGRYDMLSELKPHPEAWIQFSQRKGCDMSTDSTSRVLHHQIVASLNLVSTHARITVLNS